MKSPTLILITIIAFSLVNCGNEYSKDQALQQLYFCLDIQVKTTKVFQKRNPYLNDIKQQALVDKYRIDKSTFKVINQYSKEIDDTLIIHINQLDSLQKLHSEKKLFAATIEYLEFMRVFNSELVLFLSKIEDTLKNNEEKIALKIGRVVEQSRLESKKWNDIESNFYEYHDISQQEIDSIVEIIK